MSTLDLEILKGKTFAHTLRWETSPVVYKAITAVPQRTPRLTVSAHGVTDGWRVALSNIGGMTEANAEHEPPRQNEFVEATVVDTNTLEINKVNAASFGTYTSGGWVRYNTAKNLSGYLARFTIKDKIGGTVLIALTEVSGITIDNTAKTISITLSATATAALTWRRGVYELEMESAGGEVTQLLRGNIKVTDEVAT